MLLKILSWLSAADPEVNHVAARQLQQFGTGRWFTDGETYRNWLSPDHSFLWLHGKRMCLFVSASSIAFNLSATLHCEDEIILIHL